MMYTKDGRLVPIKEFDIKQKGSVLTTDDLARSISGNQIGILKNIMDSNPLYDALWNITNSTILGPDIKIIPKEYKLGGILDNK